VEHAAGPFLVIGLQKRMKDSDVDAQDAASSRSPIESMIRVYW